MAATIDFESVEQEILILKATGDETVSFLKKYPVSPIEDSFSLKLYRKPLTTTTPIQLQHNYDFLFDNEESKINYLIEFDENDRVYIEEYEYETIYFGYLSSLRMIIGDSNFDNIRYSSGALISYFHKALFEKVNPISSWNFTLDTDSNRVDESISDVQLGFITDYAALTIQTAELKQALRRAIVISDRSSKLDTTKHLKVMQDQVIADEKALTRSLNNYLITSKFKDGSLDLAIRNNILNRAGSLCQSAIGSLDA